MQWGLCVCVDGVKMLLSSRPISSQSSNQRASVQLRQRRLTSSSCLWRPSSLWGKQAQHQRGLAIHTGNIHRIKQRQQDKTRPLICDGWLVCGIWPSHPLGSFPPDRELQHLKTVLVPLGWLVRSRNNCDISTKTHLPQHLDWFFSHSNIFDRRHLN